MHGDGLLPPTAREHGPVWRYLYIMKETELGVRPLSHSLSS